MEIANKEHSKVFLKEILVLFLFLIALRTKQQLMVLPLLYILICSLGTMPLHHIMAVSIFCVPFSNVFKISLGTISLLSIIQLLYVGKYIVSYCRKGKWNLLSSGSMILWLFIVTVTIINGNIPIMRFVNFLLFFIIIFIENATPNDSKFSLYGQSFVFGTIASCVVGYFQTAFPNVVRFISQIEAMHEGKTVYGRFVALTEDPNILSIFILFSVAIVIALYFRKIIKMGWLVVQLVLLVFFGMLTYSKLFMIGLALITIVALLLFTQGENLKRSLLLATVGFIIVIIAYNNGFFDTFIKVMGYRLGVTSNADFSSGRFDIWLRYYRSMNESIHAWFIGYGVGGRMLSYEASHNSFVEVIYSIGIVGFFGYLAFLKQYVWSKNKVSLLLLCAVLWSTLSIDVFIQDYFYYILVILIASKNLFESRQLVNG